MSSSTATNAPTTDASPRENVWALRPGEVRKPGLHHFVMTALFTGIGIVVGTFGSLAIPLGYITAFWPGQAIQTVGGIAFRLLKADPRLKSGRDWMVFTVFGIIVSNLIGAAWGCLVLLGFGLITPGAFPVTFIGWFLGNSIASWVLGAVMLKFISPIVLKSKAFVKRVWA